MLVGRRPVRTGEQGGDADHGGGLGGYPELLPQDALRLADGVVVDEDDVRHVRLSDGEYEAADAFGGQCVYGDAAGRCVDRLALGAGVAEGRGARRFHPE
jgi:hypothetical protein